MHIFEIKREEISDTLERLYEEEQENCSSYSMYDVTEIKNDDIGEDCIIADGIAFRVTDLELIFVEGTYCSFDEETGECEPDWSLTLIYDNVPDDEFDVQKYVYFEQDPPETAIHNFLNIIQ